VELEENSSASPYGYMLQNKQQQASSLKLGGFLLLVVSHSR